MAQRERRKADRREQGNEGVDSDEVATDGPRFATRSAPRLVQSWLGPDSRDSRRERAYIEAVGLDAVKNIVGGYRRRIGEQGRKPDPEDGGNYAPRERGHGKVETIVLSSGATALTLDESLGDGADAWVGAEVEERTVRRWSAGVDDRALAKQLQ